MRSDPLQKVVKTTRHISAINQITESLDAPDTIFCWKTLESNYVNLLPIAVCSTGGGYIIAINSESLQEILQIGSAEQKC